MIEKFIIKISYNAKDCLHKDKCPSLKDSRQHKEACQTNWVCNALSFANITTTTDPLGNESEEKSVSSSPPRKSAKYNQGLGDVSFMLNGSL